MVGDLLETKYPYVLLIRKINTFHTSICSTADIDSAKAELIKSLRGSLKDINGDRMEVVHLFHNGLETQYHVSIELDDEIENNFSPIDTELPDDYFAAGGTELPDDYFNP